MEHYLSPTPCESAFRGKTEEERVIITKVMNFLEDYKPLFCTPNECEEVLGYRHRKTGVNIQCVPCKYHSSEPGPAPTEGPCKSVEIVFSEDVCKKKNIIEQTDKTGVFAESSSAKALQDETSTAPKMECRKSVEPEPETLDFGVDARLLKEMEDLLKESDKKASLPVASQQKPLETPTASKTECRKKPMEQEVREKADVNAHPLKPEKSRRDAGDKKTPSTLPPTKTAVTIPLRRSYFILPQLLTFTPMAFKPKYYWLDMAYSPRLKSGAVVKLIFSYSINKYQVVAFMDERRIYRVQESITNHMNSTPHQTYFSLRKKPVLNEIVLAFYKDNNWYRARVIGVGETDCTIIFIDLGDITTNEFYDIREITDDIFRFPVLSLTLALRGVPQEAPVQLRYSRAFNLSGMWFTLELDRAYLPLRPTLALKVEGLLLNSRGETMNEKVIKLVTSQTSM